MSLIHFHRFLIASAIAFCLGFAGWEFLAYTRGGGAVALVIAVAFAVAAVFLSVYLWHLRRILRLPQDDAGRPSHDRGS